MCSQHTTLGRARERAAERKGAEPLGRGWSARTQTRTHTAAAGLVQDDMWQPDQLVGISVADLGLTVD